MSSPYKNVPHEGLKRRNIIYIYIFSFFIFNYFQLYPFSKTERELLTYVGVKILVHNHESGKYIECGRNDAQYSTILTFLKDSSNGKIRVVPSLFQCETCRHQFVRGSELNAHMAQYH